MPQAPYRSAKRVWWGVDNGSSHRAKAAAKRGARAYANLLLVHTPVHARWLNHVASYGSIIQRKVLTPNDVARVEAVEQRVHLYEALSHQQPCPCNGKFDRAKLAQFLPRLEAKRAAPDQAPGGQMEPNQGETRAASLYSVWARTT
jgi:hypothetical protein